jgi:hypothetical protein
MALHQPVLVHDPVGLLPGGRAAPVEHERLLQPQRFAAAAVDAAAAVLARHHLVLPRGLPVPGPRGPVGPEAGRELDAPPAEEVAAAAASSGGRQQVPWLGPVEIDLADSGGGEAGVGRLRGEVVREQLLVGGPETEARRQPAVTASHPETHGHCRTCSSSASSSAPTCGINRWIDQSQTCMPTAQLTCDRCASSKPEKEACLRVWPCLRGVNAEKLARASQAAGRPAESLPVDGRVRPVG